MTTRTFAAAGLGLLLAVLATGDASAQQWQRAPNLGLPPTPQGPAPKPTGPAAPLTAANERPPVPITRSTAGLFVQHVKLGTDVATNGSLDGVPVLNGFRFRFENGDHQVKQMGMLVATPQLGRVSLFDKNHDDPFFAQASWTVVRGAGRRGTVISVGGGRFDVPLPDAPLPNHRLVLTGFEFRRNEEHNIRGIGVWLDETRNVARVSFFDDKTDQKALLTQMGDAGKPFPPNKAEADGVGILGYQVPNNAAAVKWIEGFDKSRNFTAYSAQIQYAWVPTSLFTGPHELYTGTSNQPSSNKSFFDNGAITGFEFMFVEKDHHLMDFGILPAQTRALFNPLPGESVLFQDRNRDDSLKWVVKMLSFKSP